MKRIATILLVLCLMISFAGCKKEALSKEEEFEAAVEKAVAEALAEVAEETEDGEPAKVRVDKSFGERKDHRTLQDFADAFIEAGCEVDMELKQMYEMVGAIDGVMFNMDNDVVRIYEFDNAEVMQANATHDYWDAFNGRFALEGSGEAPIDVFLSVE